MSFDVDYIFEVKTRLTAVFFFKECLTSVKTKFVCPCDLNRHSMWVVLK